MTDTTETKISPFRKFCVTQIMRLSQIPKFPFHDSGINELVNAIESRSRGDKERVKAVLDECVEFESCPSVSALLAVWNRKYPVSIAGCERCANTPGWIVAEREDGTTAAARCNHGEREMMREA